jgi:hypothetical protein
MNMKRFAVIVMAAFGVLLATAPRAQADTTCNTTYVTFHTITGNLNVPNNATCYFAAGASVTGNATVGNGATLFILGGTVSGDVQGNNCGIGFRRSWRERSSWELPWDYHTSVWWCS